MLRRPARWPWLAPRLITGIAILWLLTGGPAPAQQVPDVFAAAVRSLAAGDMAQIRHVCETLAIDGLYRSLVREQALEIPVPRECLTGLRESYRIGRDRRSAVRMATNVPAVLP